MPTALEQLGLTPEDLQSSPSGGGALGELGLTQEDLQASASGGEQLGALASGALGAAQGLTFGLSDEIAGGVHGLASSLPGGQGFQAGYREGTDYVRGLHDRAQPGAMLAGDIAGSLVLPGGAVRSGANLAAKAGRAAASGAVQGGIGAAGRAEGSIAERAPEAVQGAALGGAVGGAVGAALPAATQSAGRLIGGVDDAGADALNAVREASRVGRQGVDDAYNQITKLEGRIEGQASFDLLRSKLTRALDEGGFAYTPGVGDEAMRVADRILTDLGDSASIQQLEGARKGLNRAIGNLGADPAKRAAVNAIKDQFDDWMVDTIKNGLYRGDPDVLDTLQNARGLNAEYQRLFGVGGRTTQDRAAGRIIDQIIKDDVGPDEAVNLLFGMSGTGVKASRKAVARIRDISPEALEQMKYAHFQKILAPNGGEIDSAAKISNRIQKMNANHNQMMKTLYGDDLGALNRLGEQLRKEGRTPTQLIGNFLTSRPGLAAAGALTLGVTPGIENPFIGAIIGGLAGGRSARPANLAAAARRADRPVSSTISNRAARLGGIGPSFGERG